MPRATKKHLGRKKPSKTRKNRKPLKKNKRKNIKKGGLFGLFETDYYSKFFNDKGCYKQSRECEKNLVKSIKDDLIDLVAKKDSKNTYTLIEKNFKDLDLEEMQNHLHHIKSNDYKTLSQSFKNDINDIRPYYCKYPTYDKENTIINLTTEKDVFNKIVNKYYKIEPNYCKNRASNIVLFEKPGIITTKQIKRINIGDKLEAMISYSKEGDVLPGFENVKKNVN